MSDEFDAMKLPGELQDVVGRLRGLRPATAKADEAECMYRAGWEAALASQPAPLTRSTSSWNKSYLGGLVSGALISGTLAAAWVFGLAAPRLEPETVPDGSRVAQETVAPLADVVVAQNAHAEPDTAQPSRPLETEAAPVHTTNNELMTTAFLSPIARRQWREILTQSAAPYAAARTESTSASAPVAETLRSSPRDIDLTLF